MQITLIKIHKNIRISIAIFIGVMGFKTYAQNGLKEHTVGSSLTMHSEILGDERQLQIYLPDGYADSDITYPVLYILDGQRYFLYGVSLQKSFLEFKQTPGFIIVGISKNPSDRNRNYSANAHHYLEHIQTEVIAYVETEFRTSKTRMIFGWAYAGGFVLESMTKEPDVFNVYIAASPFPVSDKINTLDSLLTTNSNFDKRLYFTSGTNEGMVKEGTDELHTLLSTKAPKTMHWTYKELEGEEHRSTPFTTLYHALTNHFNYYPELQFNSLEEFTNAGGLPYVYAYYKERAAQFGFPTELSDWTMFSLTRNAIRASNYEQFDTLVKEFESTGFMSRLSVRRAASLGAFYLDNEKFDTALGIFTLLAEKYPDADIPLTGLGDTYKAMKLERKASRYYKKAKKLSESNAD